MLYQPMQGFQHDWTYVPSSPQWNVRLTRLRGRFARKAFPAHALIRAPSPKPVWFVYFIYAPQGRLTQGHRVALARIRDMGFALHVVCATRDAASVPAELNRYADALHWKALSGYDMSGYSLGLHDIAQHSPGAMVVLANDSVWGPLVDLRPFVAHARWDMTGFTALDITENHFQSYAWMLKGVTPARLQSLSLVLPIDWAYNWGTYAVLLQETLLARQASQSMTVGSFLYSHIADFNGDSTLSKAFELVDAGHPFLKKSLLGKFAFVQDIERVAAFVVERGLASTGST